MSDPSDQSTMPCPLSDEHLQLLNQILEQEAIQQRYLYACTNCGLGVEKLKADSDRRLQLATALKKQFFPNCI